MGQNVEYHELRGKTFLMDRKKHLVFPVRFGWQHLDHSCEEFETVVSRDGPEKQYEKDYGHRFSLKRLQSHTGTMPVSTTTIWLPRISHGRYLLCWPKWVLIGYDNILQFRLTSMRLCDRHKVLSKNNIKKNVGSMRPTLQIHICHFRGGNAPKPTILNLLVENK